MEKPIYTGIWGNGNCHIQGIAVDKKNGYIYYSFTTKLIKATLDGEIIGSVDGLVGHLGCIAFNEQDGCVYGSLEYKNDAVGQGILSEIRSTVQFPDAFYLVRFDADKIDRMDISAENSDIMSAIYLNEVVKDYNGRGINKMGESTPNRYGCSGIDGVTLAPLPGTEEKDGLFLYVAYGIYSDAYRWDNDYQILLCYDPHSWEAYAQPLDQRSMHRSGPAAPLHKYFVYTGNTCYGVQNLEYDPFTKSLFMAVYTGSKVRFPNFSLFAVDMESLPKTAKHPATFEMIEVLPLRALGNYDAASGIYGWHFPWGTTGMYSFGDGNWLFSHDQSTADGQSSYIYPYTWDGILPFQCKIPISDE